MKGKYVFAIVCVGLVVALMYWAANSMVAEAGVAQVVLLSHLRPMARMAHVSYGARREPDEAAQRTLAKFCGLPNVCGTRGAMT